MDNAIIIFIKNQIAGKVKTRIAKDSDHETALGIYKKLLTHTRNITKDLDCHKYLYYSEEITDDQWPTEVYHKKLQRGMDLGEKMMDAFIEVLSYHKNALIIGSDCIYLSAEIIKDAFDALNDHDHVLGPAKDGGYYLLGSKEIQHDLFLNIPWSSGQEYEVTKNRIISSGKSLKELQVLQDIDHLKDWEEFLLSQP